MKSFLCPFETARVHRRVHPARAETRRDRVHDIGGLLQFRRLPPSGLRDRITLSPEGWRGWKEFRGVYTVNTVDPVVLRSCRSRWARAASRKG